RGGGFVHAVRGFPLEGGASEAGRIRRRERENDYGAGSGGRDVFSGGNGLKGGRGKDDGASAAAPDELARGGGEDGTCSPMPWSCGLLRGGRVGLLDNSFLPAMHRTHHCA